MSKKVNEAKDRAKAAKKFAQLYKAAMDLAVAVEDITGEAVEIQLKLDGDSFSASAGPLKFGARSSGL